MDLIVGPESRTREGRTWRARFADRVWPCAIGKGGVTRDKREGDGATPAGCWAMRRVLYRPDRVAAPTTVLPVAPLGQEDGWCDDPDDARYNLPVTLPYAGRHERLWRDDGLYDVIVILGHNDAPPIAGRGSAIFLHVASADCAPTEGCVALALADVQALLGAVDQHSQVCVEAD